MAVYFISDVPYSDAPYSDELYHHGILGQKWGIRRFQNPDGTLTQAGRERYGIDPRSHGSFRVRKALTRLSFNPSKQKKYSLIEKAFNKAKKEFNQRKDLDDDNYKDKSREFLREWAGKAAGALLEDAGYSATPETINWLYSQSWFKNPLIEVMYD